jgi:hypothetical protein
MIHLGTLRGKGFTTYSTINVTINIDLEFIIPVLVEVVRMDLARKGATLQPANELLHGPDLLFLSRFFLIKDLIQIVQIVPSVIVGGFGGGQHHGLSFLSPLLFLDGIAHV